MLAQLFHFVIGEKWKEKKLISFPPLCLLLPSSSPFSHAEAIWLFPRKDQGYPG